MVVDPDLDRPRNLLEHLPHGGFVPVGSGRVVVVSVSGTRAGYVMQPSEVTLQLETDAEGPTVHVTTSSQDPSLGVLVADAMSQLLHTSAAELMPNVEAALSAPALPSRPDLVIDGVRHDDVLRCGDSRFWAVVDRSHAAYDVVVCGEAPPPERVELRPVALVDECQPVWG